MTISTRRLRLLRGNSSAIAGFTGLQGELVFNTDTYTLHLQDGTTSGGFSLATSAELANITANANYGNSNVSSYLASNSNIIITTTSNVTTNNSVLANNFIGANSIAIGGANSSQQHSLLISNVGTAVKFLTGNRANGNTSIQIQANNSLSGIYLRNDNGSMGFNTVPSGPNIGYTFTFNGSLYASEFYTDANMPTGYQFTTTGDTGISHIDYGDVTAIRIRHEGVETVAFYDNNTTEMRGNIVVSDGVNYGQYPNAYMQVYGYANSYQQVVNQNLSNSAAASSDFVATADNGTDTTYFIDMGINSSQFASNSWFPAANTKNDGYLYVVGSNAVGPSNGNIANLIIGSTNGVVKTFIGNTSDANVVTTVSTNLLTVSGNVNANYFIGNGSLLTGISGTGNYGNSNVVSLLSSFGSNSVVTTGLISGNLRTTTTTIALGGSAGSSGQGALTVAVGNQAGEIDQGLQATAVGSGAGNYAQGIGTTAVGTNAGAVNQGLRAVAIGALAGSQNQGAYAVAVGNFAGGSNQANNSIILSATGTNWTANTSGFFVSPVAANTTGNVLYYNTTTNEITYGSAGSTNSISNGNSNISIPTANGNVSITSAGTKTWSFSTDGNLVYPDGTKYYGKTVTLANGVENVYKWNFYDPGIGSETITLNWNLLDTKSYGQWYLSTNDSTKYWLLDSTTQQISFNPSVGGAGDGGGKITFGANTNFGNGAYNDIELTSISSNVYVRADSSIWKFEKTGALRLPGNTAYLYSLADNVYLNSDTNGYNTVEIATNADTTLRNQRNVKIITDSLGSQHTWTFGNIGDLTAPGNITTTGNISVGNILAQNIRTIEGAVHLGQGAGLLTQGTYSIAVGRFAGSQSQGNQAVAIGQLAGQLSQGNTAVAIGFYTAANTQSANAVAIGTYAGQVSQGQDSIAIGRQSGNTSQGASAISIGLAAGRDSQGTESIGIGPDAGRTNQGAYSIAIGSVTGYLNQGINAVAIGTSAGAINQGNNSVAIGGGAGSGQVDNSIVVNANGSTLTAANPGLYIDPVRNDTSSNSEIVTYNTSTKELTYTNTISINGNIITTGNIETQTLILGSGGIEIALNASPAPILSGFGIIQTFKGVNTDEGNIIAGGNLIANINAYITGNVTSGNVSATGNINASYFIGNGSQLTGITATANYNDSNVASFLANIGSNTITTTGNITGNYFIGNGALLTGISASANYGNTNVAGFLGAYGSNTIVTTGNITAGYFIGNGSTLTGVTNYSNANAVSMLSTNTNVIIGNTNAYPLQSNITQVFIGNAVALTSGGNTQPTYTNLLNNLYYDAAGALRYRNTLTGAAQMSMGGSGGFTWSGTTSAVTANAASGMGLWATLTGSTLTTYNSINITASGNLLTTAGVLNTGAGVSSLYNTTATTVNMGGAATTIAMGASTGTVTIGTGKGNLTVGNISVGSNITVGNVIGLTSNTTITAGSYTTTFDTVGNVTVSGNLTINGVYAGYAPARAAVRVYGNTSTNYTAGTTISNQVIDYNQGSYYSNSTGLFTAPIAGLYHCYATVRVGNNNALNQAALLKNDTLSGSNVVAFWETDTNTGTASHFSITGYAKCVAGDTLSLKVIAGNVQFDSNDSWGVTYIG